MRSLIQNKRGGFSDLFIFMIVAFVLILTSGMFIYFGNQTFDKLQENLAGKDYIAGGQNVSEIIDDTFGSVPRSFNALYWIASFLMVGMVMSIFIGSYLVTTKPVFFIPYIFITIIAIVVAVGVSQGYEQAVQHPTLIETYAGFTGANFIMLNLPMWVAIIGIVGAIIMFVRMGSKENDIYGGQYG